MSGIDLDTATITLTSELLRRRQVSPVELVQTTLERMEKLQPILLSFTTPVPEYALMRAKKAEREILQGNYRGRLHGIPYTLKDVIATRGICTTFGNPRGTDYKPSESATLHTLLEEAGAVLLGKVVSEIGRDSRGPVGCRNPWNPRKSPGTSSSGSGSATAASMGLLSFGTDTGGSVRHPGSSSGLVAMRATFGRISRFGVWAASWSFDQAGPLTKTVEDNAIALEVVGVPDPRDPVSIDEPRYDYRAGLRDCIKGVRIAVPVDDWVWKDWLTEEEEKVVREAIRVLGSLGACVSEVKLPLSSQSRDLLTSTAAEWPVYIRDHFSEEQIEAWPEVKAKVEQGIHREFADYLHAVHLRSRIAHEVAQVLKLADIIAMPTGSCFGDDWNAETAVIRGRKIPARSRAAYRNALACICGQPSLNVPCGFGHGETLPIGLMLQGRPLEEALLYRTAFAYEQATGWHLRHPTL